MDSPAEKSKRQRGPRLTDGVFLYEEGGKVAGKFLSEITRVRIGPQVKDIPSGTFAGCRNLAEVQFDEGTNLLTIGDNAFSGCLALRQVTIPTSVTKLDSYAFSDCGNLASVQFSEGLEII
ncbi:hypothetical protein THAOC_29991, partial [Thalassiosira oceanica]